jgi:DNA-binding protein HU-beta
VTKQEFVDRVAQRASLSRREAGEAVDAVLDSITDVLKQGGEVNFTGFGKFSTQHRKERQGVNPRNPSEKVTIPAATVPKFSAGSTLKTAVKTGSGAGGSMGGGGDMGGGGGF